MNLDAITTFLDDFATFWQGIGKFFDPIFKFFSNKEAIPGSSDLVNQIGDTFKVSDDETWKGIAGSSEKGIGAWETDAPNNGGNTSPVDGGDTGGVTDPKTPSDEA